MRIQSSMGRVYQDANQDMFMNGYLTVAKVLKVHHKSNTADVVVVNTKDTITSSYENEGRFSARILTPLAGYDNETKTSWGVVNPIMVGSLVLLGFLDNMKSRPIILGQFHEPDSINNVSSNMYPINPKSPGYQRREALKSLEVFPSQTYRKVDGEGNIEFVHPSKSFFVAYNTSADTQDYINDSHKGFDHEHVSEVDPKTGKPRETPFDESKTPIKTLYVHRSSFNDDITTWTKFFINSDGAIRITRDNNDGMLTYTEIEKDGIWRVRRQADSNIHGESEDFGEFVLDQDGSAFIQRKVDELNLARIGLDNRGNIILESDANIISDALSRFIETRHIVVGPEEPEDPIAGLIWIDTSED